MQMDKTEIVTSYKLAKEKGKQLQILADLNGCNKLAIVRILIEGGFDPRAFAKVLSKKEREAMEAEEKKNLEEKAEQAEAKPEETAVQESQSEEYYEVIDRLKDKNKYLFELNAELIEKNTELRTRLEQMEKSEYHERCSQCTESVVAELADVQLKNEKLRRRLHEAEERIQKLEKAIIKMVIE